MKSAASKPRQSGVTLTELLVVIIVAAILATLAVPSFRDFINRTRQDSVVSQLFSDLNRARSEAIKRNQWVLFCARDSDTATACDDSNNPDWNNGWLVCSDKDRNKKCDNTIPSDPNPIAVHQKLHSDLSLTVKKDDGSNLTVIQFNPDGTSRKAATLTLTGNWDGAQVKTIRITVTGNISKPEGAK